METINLRGAEQVSEAPHTLGAPSCPPSRPVLAERAENFGLSVHGLMRSGHSTPPTEGNGKSRISVRETCEQPSSDSPERVYYVNQTSVNVDDQGPGKDHESDSKLD